MGKVIRIMVIAAAALIALSLMLMLITIPFQSTIARDIFNYPPDILHAFPQFPLVQILNALLRLACVVLLIICCGNKKGGIWLELLALGCMVVILPLVSQIVSAEYHNWVGRMGHDAVIAYSFSNTIAGYCFYPANWAQALAYVACGMSIVYKNMSKKADVVEVDEEEMVNRL